MKTSYAFELDIPKETFFMPVHFDECKATLMTIPLKFVRLISCIDPLTKTITYLDKKSNTSKHHFIMPVKKNNYIIVKDTDVYSIYKIGTNLYYYSIFEEGYSIELKYYDCMPINKNIQEFSENFMNKLLLNEEV